MSQYQLEDLPMKLSSSQAHALVPRKGNYVIVGGGVSRGATGSRLQGVYLHPVTGHHVWSAQRDHCDQMGKKIEPVF